MARNLPNNTDAAFLVIVVNFVRMYDSQIFQVARGLTTPLNPKTRGHIPHLGPPSKIVSGPNRTAKTLVF